MPCSLSLQDVSAAGIGLDIAGAWLLGRGLLQQPKQVARRAMAEHGMNIDEAAAQIEDRADAQPGLMLLVLGFFLQALGYVLSLWIEDGGELGWRRGVMAAAFGLGAAALGLLVGGLGRERRIKRFAVRTARYVEPDDPCPDVDWLASMGLALGFISIESDMRCDQSGSYIHPESYVRRVFGIDCPSNGVNDPDGKDDL